MITGDPYISYINLGKACEIFFFVFSKNYPNGCWARKTSKFHRFPRIVEIISLSNPRYEVPILPRIYFISVNKFVYQVVLDTLAKQKTIETWNLVHMSTSKKGILFVSKNSPEAANLETPLSHHVCISHRLLYFILFN